MFLPVQQASAPHIIAGQMAGPVCVGVDHTVSGTIDNDELKFTFANTASPFYIVNLLAVVNQGGLNNEAFGVQLSQDVGTKETRVDGATLTLSLDDANANAPDLTPGAEILSLGGINHGIFVESELVLIIDDDEGGQDIDAGDVLRFTICGMTSNPTKIITAGGTDITTTQVTGT